MLPTLHLALPGTHVAIATHGLAVVAAVIAGLLLAVRRAREPRVVLAWGPAVAMGGLLGAHALGLALHGGPPLAGGPLSAMGGIAAGLGVALLAARTTGASPATLLDALGPGVVLGLAVGRVGCFLAGCCAGGPTTLPWALVVPALGPVPRHPVALYAAAADLLLLAWVLHAPRTAGAALRRTCLGLGVVRLLLEPLRDPSGVEPLAGGGLLTVGRVGAVLLVAGALATWRRQAPGRRLALP